MDFQSDVDPLQCDLALEDLTVPSVAFAAWWWQPEVCGSGGAGGHGTSLLARRMAQPPSELTLSGLEDVADWQWADLAELSVAQRLECAAYFAALLMAQPSPVARRLEGLSPSDRHWALAISSIQPLPRRLDWGAACDDIPDEIMGMAELGFWVRSGFDALWHRLLRDFDASDRCSLVALTQQRPSLSAPLVPSVSRRVRRCWLLAKHRLENRDGVR